MRPCLKGQCHGKTSISQFWEVIQRAYHKPALIQEVIADWEPDPEDIDLNNNVISENK